MKKLLAAVALAACLAAPAFAALPEGTKAPDITATGMLDGKEFTFKLSDALKKGPVVIYFFPAAFTQGCTIETKAFADAADQFKAAGATLVGLTAGAQDPDTKKYMSAKDNLPLLQKFSEEDCRNKFPIAAVDLDTVKAFNVILPQKPDWSDRTSYVIGKDGKIALAYTDMKPNDHITKTLEAVKALK
ncbi:MAG TPA: redoxin domain-containing protein [Hyphomonadaceae bacterium]|nr:redoxin domain-containing protein [Hyphomonadaceae bacterium]